MTRKILFCMTLLMFGVFLVGCGSDENADGGSPQDPQEIQATQETQEKQVSEDTQNTQDTSQCTEVYTFAPANFVIHIVSGESVVLDPDVGNFPVYCGAEKAKEGLENALEAKKVPEGEWKIYRLEGQWDALAREVEANLFFLKQAARLVSWVN